MFFKRRKLGYVGDIKGPSLLVELSIIHFQAFFQTSLLRANSKYEVQSKQHPSCIELSKLSTWRLYAPSPRPLIII
jgi:hypothetical protein